MKFLRIAIASVALVPIAAATAQIAPRHAAPSPEQMAAYHAMPDTAGTGPYPAIKEVWPSFPGHVIYRPAELGKLGARKLGVVAWGNGGCSDDGASARLHLAEIASHGYLVIAPGHIRSGPGVPPAPPRPRAAIDPITGKLPPYPTQTADLIDAIDWAVAENSRQESPLRDRIDTAKVAVSGHSCGGLQALDASFDPRVKAVLIHNSALFPDDANPIQGLTITKASLAKMRAPVLYIVGGPKDNFTALARDDFNRIDNAPVILADTPVGHHGTFREPNGGAAASVAVDWLEWQLFGNTTAAQRFVGPDCGLCTDPRWTVQQKTGR